MFMTRPDLWKRYITCIYIHDCLCHGCIIESGSSDFSIHSYKSCSVAHEAKMAQFHGSKNTWIRRCSSASWGPGDMRTSDSSSSSVCNSSRAGYFRFSAQLARTGLKRALTALLDFPSVIRSNESNPDGETSHFAAVCSKKIIYRITDHSFPMKSSPSEWGKVFLSPMASRD